MLYPFNYIFVYVVGLQITVRQMPRSMEQIQRSMAQIQRSTEKIKLFNRLVNIGSEMDQEIEGKHPVDNL